MREINKALLRIAKRAERKSSVELVETFVDVGALLTSVQTIDHQIIYGRRGTGKTHVLAVLAVQARDRGDLAVRVDMRTLGSTGGLYTDSGVPVTERATRLIADLLNYVHDELLRIAIDDASIDFGVLGPRLDEFAGAICEVRVVGEVSQSDSAEVSASKTARVSSEFSLSAAPTLSIGGSDTDRSALTQSQTRAVVGPERHRVHFGSIAGRLTRVTDALGDKRVWVLLDEWSEVPLSIQPLLADLLRRTLFPNSNVTVKIAAIEQRTSFRSRVADGEYVGIEVGADAAVSLNLDEFMVFDNSAEAATAFFRALIAKHVRAAADGGELESWDEKKIASELFTQVTALSELVRAAEGVPRDAINIASQAAQRANDSPIGVGEIRYAARQWYLQSKEQSVSARADALLLLQWIVEQVIRGRKAKAFLLNSAVRHPLIDFLYDERVLHVIKRGVSSNDHPGVRFTVYAIDYGCYADLISTNSAPKGLFDAGGDDVSEFVEVPATDYRSIRRAVLSLKDFEEARPAHLQI